MRFSHQDLTFLCFLILTGAIVGYILDPPPTATFTKKDLLRALKNKSQQQITTTTTATNGNGKKKILLGLNTNLDAIVNDGPSFLKQLNGVDEYVKPVDGSIIGSPQDLASIFTHHFTTSSAGERTIKNETLWKEIESALEQDAYSQISLGGNAALMAEALAKCKSSQLEQISLVGMTGTKIAGRLSSKINVIPGQKTTLIFNGGQDRFHADVDQVHLILEYSSSPSSSGSKWGGKKPDRSNRFIVSSDSSNGVLAALDSMIATTHANTFDIIVLAGIHMMDGITNSVREERLRSVTRYVSSVVPLTSRVHFELGSVGDKDFARQMIHTLVLEGCTDSLGLNEQEFVSVLDSIDAFGSNSTSSSSTTKSSSMSLNKDTRTALLASIPPVIKVQAGITKLFDTILAKQQTTYTCQHVLSRVHFHSFGYHLIVQRKSSSNGNNKSPPAANWPNPEQAVAAGSIIATERACSKSIENLHGAELNLNVSGVKYSTGTEDKTAQVTVDNPVIMWIVNDLSFYLTPVLACVHPKQTVGLGDYISATALASQL
jgi:ADP-dependent phosphofructokinase/glucokinase